MSPFFWISSPVPLSCLIFHTLFRHFSYSCNGLTSISLWGRMARWQYGSIASGVGITSGAVCLIDHLKEQIVVRYLHAIQDIKMQHTLCMSTSGLDVYPAHRGEHAPVQQRRRETMHVPTAKDNRRSKDQKINSPQEIVTFVGSVVWSGRSRSPLPGKTYPLSSSGATTIDPMYLTCTSTMLSLHVPATTCSSTRIV